MLPSLEDTGYPVRGERHRMSAIKNSEPRVKRIGVYFFFFFAFLDCFYRVN